MWNEKLQTIFRTVNWKELINIWRIWRFKNAASYLQILRVSAKIMETRMTRMLKAIFCDKIYINVVVNITKAWGNPHQLFLFQLSWLLLYTLWSIWKGSLVNFWLHVFYELSILAQLGQSVTLIIIPNMNIINKDILSKKLLKRFLSRTYLFWCAWDATTLHRYKDDRYLNACSTLWSILDPGHF